MKKYHRLLPFLVLTLMLTAANAATQARNPLPPSIIAGMEALRDAMYMSASPETIENDAERLISALRAASLSEADRALAIAGAEYYAARAWKEVENKTKAIPHYEEAIVQARAALADGETAPRIVALMKPLSELCLLKDMAFLMANGPKIGQYAKRALVLEPGYPAATIAIAASKAYPPAIFGGKPKEALSEMEAFLALQSGAVPGDGAKLAKDDLFDLRMCMATAYEKLGRKAEAAAWYRQALELYPANAYARDQLKKANP